MTTCETINNEIALYQQKYNSLIRKVKLQFYTAVIYYMVLKVYSDVVTLCSEL